MPEGECAARSDKRGLIALPRCRSSSGRAALRQSSSGSSGVASSSGKQGGKRVFEGRADGAGDSGDSGDSSRHKRSSTIFWSPPLQTQSQGCAQTWINSPSTTGEVPSRRVTSSLSLRGVRRTTGGGSMSLARGGLDAVEIWCREVQGPEGPKSRGPRGPHRSTWAAALAR